MRADNRSSRACSLVTRNPRRRRPPALPESREKNRLDARNRRLITNHACQINHLRSRYPASSGTVLREADRPLRERAGRESLDMTTATPARCDNRQNRIAEVKEAAYGGRPARLQGGPRPPLHTGFRKGQSGNPGGRPERRPGSRGLVTQLTPGFRLPIGGLIGFAVG
jgi:hypothetical protein